MLVELESEEVKVVDIEDREDEGTDVDKGESREITIKEANDTSVVFTGFTGLIFLEKLILFTDISAYIVEKHATEKLRERNILRFFLIEYDLQINTR